MLISPSLTTNNQTNQGYNDLLKAIDNKIADIASVQLFNDIYAVKKNVNMCLFEKLCDYKEILLDKLIGCNCLKDEHLIYITSQIQKLIDTQF